MRFCMLGASLLNSLLELRCEAALQKHRLNEFHRECLAKGGDLHSGYAVRVLTRVVCGLG